MITQISPSAFSLFEKDREDFYLKYLSPVKSPRPPQTKPMAVGSAFDSYIKAHIAKHFDIKGFNLNDLLNQTVEAHNREWARTHGMVCFQMYRDMGALAELMLLMDGIDAVPRMEFKVKTVVGEVPIGGKPDLWFVRPNGLGLVHDWKVNGYLSKSKVSPHKGYLKGYGPGKPKHGECIITEYEGITVNMTGYFNPVWLYQLTMYGWCLGAEVGKPFVVSVDQICGIDRIATHRTLVRESFQLDLLSRLQNCWDIINSNHIFRDLTYKESLLKQKHLDRVAEQLNDPDFQKLIG